MKISKLSKNIDNKLFYFINENDINKFKNNTSLYNTVGIVVSDNATFGYIIFNGKQYSISENEMDEIISTIIHKSITNGDIVTNMWGNLY